MTTSNAKRTTTPTEIESPKSEPVQDTSPEPTSAELPQDHPMKGDPTRGQRVQENAVAAPPEPDWKAEAIRIDGEARFWKSKYFEALQNSQSQAQVIAQLARPQLEADARQQAELMAKLAGLASQ